MLINKHLKKIITIASGLILSGCGQVSLPSQFHQAKTSPLLCENQTQMTITTHLTFDNQSDKVLIGKEKQSNAEFPLLPDKTMVITKEDTIPYSALPAKGKPLTYSYIFRKVDDGKSFGTAAVTFSMLLPQGVDLSTLNATRVLEFRSVVGEIACVVTQRCPTAVIECKATFANPDYPRFGPPRN